jgi:DNA-binding FadR family transcriptional regulator
VSAERSRAPVSEQFPRIRTPWKTIVAEAVDGIRRGDIVPGEPLPSLAELSEMYGVNRKAAHKALKYLEAEGYAEARPGKPYRVPEAG